MRPIRPNELGVVQVAAQPQSQLLCRRGVHLGEKVIEDASAWGVGVGWGRRAMRGKEDEGREDEDKVCGG
jgi:hypothetical protein